MNEWITCYRKEDDKLKDRPYTIQFNRANIISISLFPDRLEIEFIDRSVEQLFFSEWDIKL